MIRNLPTRLFIVCLCTLLLLISYFLAPKNKIVGSIHQTKTFLVDKSKQKTVSEFNSTEREKYAYVSFDNLYANTSLYYGTRIFQSGHIKDMDMERRYLLVALDGNDASRMIKLKYNLSNFARGSVDLEENDPIKFYGRVLSTDSYVNEKGRDIERPVISADFIQTKLGKQGENYGAI